MRANLCDARVVTNAKFLRTVTKIGTAMAKHYYVDWDDPHYPKIRDLKFATQRETPLTFAEAKAEIIEHFQIRKRDAEYMIAQTRALRVSDLVVS